MPFALKPPVSLSYVWVKQVLSNFTLGQKNSKAFTYPVLVSDSRVQYLYSSEELFRTSRTDTCKSLHTAQLQFVSLPC